jgi:hypothetical protein
VQAGYNYAHLSPNKTSSEIFSYSTGGVSGFQAGAFAEVRLSKSWIIRPAILINGKGTKLNKIGFNDTSSRIIEINYLEIPVSMVYKWNVGKKSIAFAGVGIYLARAFRGVEKGEGHSLGGPYFINNFVEFHSKNEENDGLPTIIKPLDYGFNLLVGVERQSIQLMVSYGQGLQRVFPKSLVFEEKFTNRVFSLSAIYLFKTKR